MTARPWTRATARALSLTLRFTALGVGASLALAACSRGESRAADTAAGRTAAGDSASGAARCAGDNGGITLPAGFCATVFADAVGGPRHIVVASNGDVFTQLITAKKGAESGRGAGGILALRDANRDGVADTTVLFGKVGGTGIALFDGYLYADETSRIVRYKLPAGSLTPQGDAETIVSGIPTGGHEARNFVIDSAGTLYLNIGSRTNSCQLKDRANDSKGHDPCTELDTRAGLWKFDARRTGQRPTTANRFATGIRNGMGLAFAPDGKLYATQHGRDQLFQNWQSVGFDARYSADNPAEELLQVNQGDDFGWPYCYYAQDQKHLVTAPEYGGDGRKTDRCTGKKEPVAVFGGHWAPMTLLFYRGGNFPAKYRDGAFIAFHGSWNRAPEPQAGYRVVFQPLANGAASGSGEDFATGFPGTANPQPDSPHRPMGLAEAPDGSLYITDDRGGRIWKVTYQGAR